LPLSHSRSSLRAAWGWHWARSSSTVWRGRRCGSARRFVAGTAGWNESRYFKNKYNHSLIVRTSRHNPDGFISGPVFIPKIYYGKNKTFFFYGMSMLIEKQGKQLTATAPTPAMLNGGFSFAGSGVVPNAIYDPSTTAQVNGVWTRSPFPGNIIPKARWSKVATAFLGLNPIGLPDVPGNWTTTGPSNNVQMGPMKITKWQNHTARLDHQFTTAVKGFASYTYNHEWGRQPTLSIVNPLFDSSLNRGITDRHTGSFGVTWIASPTVVNDIRFTYYGRVTPTQSIALNQDYASLIGMGTAEDLYAGRGPEPDHRPGESFARVREQNARKRSR
jgi:hypothetical protein